jgi:hypothetical protein
MADPYIHSKNQDLLGRTAKVLEDDTLLEAVPPRTDFQAPTFPAEASRPIMPREDAWKQKKGYLIAFGVVFALFLTLVGILVARMV